jgi:hypothetical protein
MTRFGALERVLWADVGRRGSHVVWIYFALGVKPVTLRGKKPIEGMYAETKCFRENLHLPDLQQCGYKNIFHDADSVTEVLSNKMNRDLE